MDTQRSGVAQWSSRITPRSTLLFRYSALNGHRIHDDADYAREVQGYPGLVVHGPLPATQLLGFAQSLAPGARLAHFTFCGMAPLFVDAPFDLQARESAAGLTLWARSPSGGLAMQAEAGFA